jgi:nucleoid DNA-binding protein
MGMTKGKPKVQQDLFIKSVANEAGLHQKDVRRVISALKNQIALQTSEGKVVAILGFGMWEEVFRPSKPLKKGFGYGESEEYDPANPKMSKAKNVIKHTCKLKLWSDLDTKVDAEETEVDTEETEVDTEETEVDTEETE